MNKFIDRAVLSKYALVVCCAVCLMLPALVIAGEYNSNLVINGDAESVTAGDASGTKFPGWISDDHVTIAGYGGEEGFPADTDSGPPSRGKNFFYGGEAASASAKQTIDISFAATGDIDAGKVSFKLSAWLGGYLYQEDTATVTVGFYDDQATALKTFTIGPVSAEDRSSETSLLERTVSDNVPAKTRSVVVEMKFTRWDGTYIEYYEDGYIEFYDDFINDGYADNVSLIMTNANPSTETLPIDQWVSGFDINIDKQYVDVLLPSPTFSEEYYRLNRSYNPFSNFPGLNFEGAILKAGIGAVRVEHLKINDVDHWVDLTVDVNRQDLAMTITGIAPGTPPVNMPHWNGNFPGVDFSLASADIFGPPTRVTMFDVGIEGRLYDVDFLLNPATEFVLSKLTPKGYFHYLPARNNPELVVSSALATPPNYTGSGTLNLPGVSFHSPLAFFGWTGGDGEQEMLINYATGSQVQRMMARGGTLVGSYSPPSFGPVAKALNLQEPAKIPKEWPAWLRSPTVEETLNNCIDEKTKVITGFKADNELSQQLIDLVFTVAGHDKLKLSNGTLEKIRTAIADSKDAVMELMANGKADSATLGIFVSSTVLKNATPAEHELIIEQVWGNKIPDHAKTAAGVSGSAVESNYKLAAQALADGLASTFFPAYTAAVKTVIESAKYANDTLADQAFQELYKVYKNNDRDWDFVENIAVLGTNKFAAQKVRNILESQGKASDDAAISAYLKNKMQTLYAQEQQSVKEREKLVRAKDSFLDLGRSQKEALNRMLGGAASQCDLFQKYLDFAARAQLDLMNSMGDCKFYRPSKSDIEAQAYYLAGSYLEDGTVAERRALYQDRKLGWLKAADCLRYEDVRKNACSGIAKAGANTPETVKVELGQVSGSFTFDYETYSAKDRMIVAYENAVLFDSGCVGTNGWKSTTIPYAGKSSQILVRVEPNCAGTSNTQWQFKASCPDGN